MSNSFTRQHALTPARSSITRPWIVLTSVVFGAIMAFLDATMVNIALVSIQKGLSTDLPTVSWVLNSYNITFAMALIPAGYLADRFGRKRLFLCGIALFGAGSLICALAPSIAWLIAARAMQGSGGAILTAVGLAIISGAFPGESRGAAIGIWGALSGLAIAVGPALGGFLIHMLNWRWIFLVNLPLCLISLSMVVWYVPETLARNQGKRIDIVGLLLLFTAILCLVLGIIQGNAWGWLSPTILLLFAAALINGLLFVFVEQRQTDPMIQLRLFTIPTFAVANIIMFLFAIALMGAFVIFVLFLQERGDDPLQAAFLLLPTPLSAFMVSSCAGTISRYFSARIQAVVGMLMLALGLALLGTVNVDVTFLDAAWRGCIIGAGMGLCFASLPTLALSEMPSTELGVGSGVFNSFQQVGFTLGVAILISILVSQDRVPPLHGFVVTWLAAACIAGIGGMFAFFIGKPYKKQQKAYVLEQRKKETNGEAGYMEPDIQVEPDEGTYQR